MKRRPVLPGTLPMPQTEELRILPLTLQILLKMEWQEKNTVHQERAHSVNLEKETLEQGGSADKGNATGSVRAFTADTGWGNDPRRNISRERPEIHRKTLAERRQEQEVQVKTDSRRHRERRFTNARSLCGKTTQNQIIP